uniref:Uncharacterized protein n=1 Tax=Meloidogyne enterolobii TaxID=390850 RepID=A0A6V7W926_MELEN|nr:unnamed protein product [Meloidogyne enterolobii]
MRSSTLFLLAVVLLAVIVQLHAGPQAGQKPAATKKKAIEGKPTGNKVASKQNKGKPKGQASNKIVHAAKEGAQHAKDAVSKLAHGNKPNGEVIGDDKLKTEIKTVLDGMIKHPEKIKQGNKAKLVKAVTCQVCKKINQDKNQPKDQKLSKKEKKELKKLNKEKTKKLNAQIKKLLNNDAALKKEMDELFNAVEKAHGKKAAALPKTNSGHSKKPAVAHPQPKNAQAKSGLLNVKQAHRQHNTNQAAASPISKSGPLKNLAGLKAMHKIPGLSSGGLHATKHVSAPKSAETPPKHSPINSENLRRNVSSPLVRGNVGNNLPNSSNPSVPGALPSNMFGGKTEMDSDEDWDAEDVDVEEFSNRPIGNNGLETSGGKLSSQLKPAEDDYDNLDDNSLVDDGLDKDDSLGDVDEDLSNSSLDKAESDENGKGASEEDKSNELDVDDFKENELNSNLMKKAEDKDLLSEGNDDLDQELKKKAFNEEVRKATELALKVGDEIKEMNVPKVNSAPQVKNSLFDQIGNPAPVGLVGA